MKKLVYAMLVALVGSPPAFAQIEESTDESDIAVSEGADVDTQEREPLSDAEMAANDAAKAAMSADVDGEDTGKPDTD